MIIGARRAGGRPPLSAGDERHWQPATLDRERRWSALGTRGATVWFTGLPASGKSTIAAASRSAWSRRACAAYRLDGDNLRHGLNGDLGFARRGPRRERAPRRRTPRACWPTPGRSRSSRSSRPTRPTASRARAIHEATACRSSRSSSTRRSRSASAATRRACTPGRRRRRDRPASTGVDDPYEAPDAPDVVIASDSVEAAVAKVLAELAL